MQPALDNLVKNGQLKVEPTHDLRPDVGVRYNFDET
jgi:hypothetical protein